MADIASVITAKLTELRGKVSPDNLFSPSGANGEVGRGFPDSLDAFGQGVKAFGRNQRSCG